MSGTLLVIPYKMMAPPCKMLAKPHIISAATHLMFVYGGGLQGEKTSKKNFVPDELKSPKNNMFFFVFYVIGGWVGGWFRSKCVILHVLFFNSSLT